ncbi:phosphoribosylaminoimidazolesuccinocarboxamide synthase [Brumimicrobium salinarum]|uniref:Phosphoribosylaminoimidazole-succinocarboxamide synthase n=1 Tax=Brumimicrobium salinarum TaxID=2058658 RepID=A0A2I0R2M8_9FLAO|nr:phosphoribosylaminoimidazolesuccinocarboxamide synthase [Brumimicrobium salinarum]PKR80650.1 phosphoribosylaminoimidazolesuccinocarboxamide synthase [Brumimicrobium salinarum]
MMKSLTTTDFNFPNQTEVYKGKVRDVYFIGEEYIVMIASDRISAFDHILPAGIPFKGQVLNQVATYFLKATEDILPNWLIDVPDPNVAVGHKCEPIRIEMVIRGYLTGHAWREYKAGKRTLCGVEMPEGMNENDPFPEPIITPSTKAVEGHDEDISKVEILNQGIVSKEVYEQLEKYTHQLYQRGVEMAKERGLILVDTKYEFGMKDGQVMLMDEIHTPDSSRYFYLDGYQERQDNKQPQRQLSKEFVRQWLIEHDFQGLEGQEMPVIPEDFIALVTQRYIELYEKITGQSFKRADTTNIETRIESNTRKSLQGKTLV